MKSLQLHHPLRELYREADLPNDIRRSLNFILLGNLCGNIHGIICGGQTTAMVGFATSLGANDLTFAILNAVPQAAALLQLPFSILVNRTHQRKKYMLTLGIFCRALWILFGLVPFFVPKGTVNYQLYTIIFLLGISSACGAVINVCWFPWFSDLAPISIRGRWLSVRDVILSIVNILAGLVIAYLLDHLPPENKYVIIFALGGIIGVMDMCCFGFCREVYSAPAKRLKVREVLSGIGHNRPFMHFLAFWTVWCFAANMSGTYMSPYSMNVMGLSFTQIMLFATVASCAGAVLAVQRWGVALFRYGCRSVMLVCCTVAALTPAFYLFSSPGNIWPTLLHNFIGAMFWCGSNLAANSMQLSTSTDDTRPTYIAIFSCITALAGTTLGSLTAGALLHFWDSSGMFTGWFDRYKMLFLIAVAIRISAVWLLVPRMENDRDKTASDLVRAAFHHLVKKHAVQR